MSPDTPTEAPAPVGAPVPRRRSRRKTILIIGLTVFGLLALGTVGFAAYGYHHLNENIATIQDNQDQADRPVAVQPEVPAAKPPLNILLIGSDTRDGDNSFVGGPPGVGHSDTTILLHVSGDRSRALAVSIPRDSMVEMPSCKTRTGATEAPGLRMFNEAYAIGGASCVRRTVEQLTDIRIDHFVVVDFAGFEDMVSALGGVKVYLPQSVDDGHGIHFDAGCQTLDGDQSLKYVRVRHGIGDGSDIDRLQRQQAFLSSVIQKVTSRGTLTNPVKLYKFLDAATKAVSTDSGLDSVRKLASLAEDLRNVGLNKIEFMTIPVEQWPQDHNRVVWTDQADVVWKAIRNDKPLPGHGKANSGEPPLVAAPSTIYVKVYNATGAPGAAQDAADELTSLGYHVVGVDTWATHRAHSLVRWSEPRDESARTVAAATNTTTTKQVDGLGQTVTLVIGADYDGAHKVKVKSSTTDTFQTRTADTPVCS